MLIAGIVFGLVVLLLWGTMVRPLRALFATPHLIELREALAGLRQAALDRRDADPPRGPDDPRAYLSRAGLAVVYTMRTTEHGIVHHVSVSRAGRPTPHAVGRAFTLLAVDGLGLPTDRCRFAVFPSTVHHAEVVLDPAAHDAVLAIPTRSLTPAEATDRLRWATAPHASIQWERVAA